MLLTLRYDHDPLRKPYYLNNVDVELVAYEARAQLVQPGSDALSLEMLAGISELNINGLAYKLWVSLEHTVTDDDGRPVLGLCEFDARCGEDAVSVLVSPVGEHLSAELALSTFAHELGHAIFDAPAWLAAARQGPGLFDEYEDIHRRVYRTTTGDVGHLSGGGPGSNRDTTVEKGGDSVASVAGAHEAIIPKEIRFAEWRANEFMGSLLVPRDRLVMQALELAPNFGISPKWPKGLANDLKGDSVPQFVVPDDHLWTMARLFEQDLATSFGVTRKFIKVRMERYGLWPSGVKAS